MGSSYVSCSNNQLCRQPVAGQNGADHDSDDRRLARPRHLHRRAAPDGARMNAVELLVRDLDTMTAYYQQAVTLDILDQSGASATLGRAGEPIMRLRQEKDLPTADPRAAGLYSTRRSCSRMSRGWRPRCCRWPSAPRRPSRVPRTTSSARRSTSPTPKATGFLELYHDRPREQWQVAPDGSVHMDSLALDPNQFLRQGFAARCRGTTARRATIGHVHLQVGDIPTARRFYPTSSDRRIRGARQLGAVRVGGRIPPPHRRTPGRAPGQDHVRPRSASATYE